MRSDLDYIYHLALEGMADQKYNKKPDSGHMALMQIAKYCEDKMKASISKTKRN